jgi:AcrR family transcriptional regulator
MPKAKSPTARGAQRRAEILEAATELFIGRGYAGASTDEIVRRGGGSKESVYTNFGNKEGLFRAVIEAYATVAQRSIDIAALDPSAPETSLRKIGISFLATIASRKSVEMLRLIIAESDRVPEARETFLRSGPQASKRSVAGFLTRCKESGSLRIADAEQYSEVFHGMLTEPLFSVVLRKKPLSAREVAAHVDRILPLFLRMCARP